MEFQPLQIASAPIQVYYKHLSGTLENYRNFSLQIQVGHEWNMANDLQNNIALVILSYYDTHV